MSQIIKTEAVVLSKLNYGDTSSIVSLFTEEEGKLSAIVKGARSPKSKYGRIIDPINHLLVVIYKKESREVQMISGADILEHYPAVKSNLEKLKFAYATIELIKNLTAEHEVNKNLFKALIQILSEFNSSNEQPEIIFGRFLMFILKVTGYEIQIENCSLCGKAAGASDDFYFNFDKGLICGKCRKPSVDIFRINPELLTYLLCLKNNFVANSFNNNISDRAIELIEKFLKYHVPGFKGIQSLKLFV
jgi:DNA repair protein RecO (recombination protein O)